MRHHQAAREWPETEAAVETIRAELIKELLETKPEESLRRDKLVLSIQALDRVKSVLLATLQDGKVLEHIEALKGD